jgi:hypothetical protein
VCVLQATEAARYVEEIASQRDATHVVLAGDFNAAPDSAGVRFWRGLQSLGDTSVCYRDAWERAHPGEEGHTFTPRNSLVSDGEWALELGRRIDYVMARCGHHGSRSRSSRASGSSTKPWTACGRATISAWSRTSARLYRAEDRCCERPYLCPRSRQCAEGPISEVAPSLRFCCIVFDRSGGNVDPRPPRDAAKRRASRGLVAEGAYDK